MMPNDLRGWRHRLKLSQRMAADELGISTRQVKRYEAGDPIPRYMALACQAIETDLTPPPKAEVCSYCQRQVVY